MHDIDDDEVALLVGAWLARWRTRTGVSQRYLAARAGISQGGLSRVERGLQRCGARRLGRLIWVLDELSSGGSPTPVSPPPIWPPRPDSTDITLSWPAGVEAEPGTRTEPAW